MSAHDLTRRARACRRQRGMSIIELMVGIVISMLVGIAATGSAVMFTAAQRQAVGVGGAGVNASNVLAALKGDAALAGLGFFNNSVAMCSTLNMSMNNTVLSNGAAFAPVRITRDGDFATVEILYASLVDSGASAQSGALSDGTEVRLQSLLPAVVGQSVVMAPDRISGLCTLRTVTSVTASSATTPQILEFGNTGLFNKAVFSTAASYPRGSRIALLGDVRWNRYGVTGTNLELTRPLDSASAVLARDVMAFRVQYGVSASATATTLDSWEFATGSWASITTANIDRVRALRVGMIVRSPQIERKDASGNCVATDTAPQVFGFTPSVFSSTTNDWRCYRYRITTAIVPLRNFVF